MEGWGEDGSGSGSRHKVGSRPRAEPTERRPPALRSGGGAPTLAAMLYRLLADLVVLLHSGFILFALLGGLAAIKRPRIAWLHVPALAWAVAVEAAGWVCPLTPLERHLRLAAGQTAYAGGFVEHYLIPILYPGSLTRPDQLLLAMALLLFNAVVYGAVRRRRGARTPAPEAGTVSPGGMFLAAAGLQGAVLLLALGVGPLLGAPPLRGLRFSVEDAAWGLAAALPLALVVIVAVHREVPRARRLAETVEDVLKPLLAGSPARLALLSALAGLGEEALFRGVLQSALGSAAGAGAGWLAAGALFGAAHFVSRDYAVLATLFGLYLGGLYLWSGNLLVPAAAHAAYDFALLLYLRRRVALRA